MEQTIKHSARQKKFIKAVENAGLEVNFDYSGRGMYGKTCPSVTVSSLADFPGNPYKYEVDNMGLGYVVYAQH